MGNPKPLVCVQGLGFVGTAMALAIADARDNNGLPVFEVIGIELPNEVSKVKVDSINAGKLPVASTDLKLAEAMQRARKAGNLKATTDCSVYGHASIIVVDVHLDVAFDKNPPEIKDAGFRGAIRTIGENMRPGTLVVIETTVPPGACEKVVAPELRRCLSERGFAESDFLLAHSYERVMPGKDYFDSIVNFWRVYSGLTPDAADACEDFLSKVVNTRDYPLTRLQSTTESEIAKVLENSYRALNIAFIEEWGRFAESVGANLFSVIDAVRMRPTHSNIRQPGFGVGGYCLTKDPLLAPIAAREYFDLEDAHFPFSCQAVSINEKMPLVSLRRTKELLGGDLENKRLLLLGVSYRQDVGDTRYSPSQTFVEEARAQGAVVDCHDPLVRYWPELDENLPAALPSPRGYDAVIFAVPHEEYTQLDLVEWLDKTDPIVLDANRVFPSSSLQKLRQHGYKIYAIGRGDL